MSKLISGREEFTPFYLRCPTCDFPRDTNRVGHQRQSSALYVSWQRWDNKSLAANAWDSAQGERNPTEGTRMHANHYNTIGSAFCR
jgi:hypothetical protein